MKSFEDANKVIIEDTKVPDCFLPLIIVHWLCDYYYGGTVTVSELREFLEPKMRDKLYEREVVNAWIRNAQLWSAIDHQRTLRLLAEYHQIEIAA